MGKCGSSTCSWEVTACTAAALEAAEVKEVMLLARGPAAFEAALAAAAAAIDNRCATISVGDNAFSFFAFAAFNFSKACKTHHKPAYPLHIFTPYA